MSGIRKNKRTCVLLEEKMSFLTASADRLLEDINHLTSGGGLVEELPALRLSLRKLKNSFASADEEIRQALQDEEDAVRKRFLLEMQLSCQKEQKWIKQMEETLAGASLAAEAAQKMEEETRLARLKGAITSAQRKEAT